MTEQLMNLVKEQAATALKGNPAIPADKAGAAVSELSSSFSTEIGKQISGGNIEKVNELLSGKAPVNDNPIVNSIKSDAIKGFTAKLGLNEGVAGSIISSVVPVIISQVAGKMKSGELNLQSIAGNVAGNLKENIGGMAGKIMGE